MSTRKTSDSKMGHRKILYLIAMLSLIVFILSSCQVNQESANEELTIFAAASLRETFNDLKLAFESENPGTDIQINYAASSTLQAQIKQGAEADLFASADYFQIWKLSTDVGVSKPIPFAQNDLALVVSQKTAGIDNFDDILAPGIKIVTALPEVPIGSYSVLAIKEIEMAGYYGNEFPDNFARNIVSMETNVRSMLSRVVLGEVDAAIVYSTDISKELENSVKRISFPIKIDTKPTYFIATLVPGDEKEASTKFLELLSSEEGAAILLDNGFRPIKQDN